MQALYDYSGTSSGDLSFRKGQVIFVSKAVNSNWWVGSSYYDTDLNTNIGSWSGLFPSNYVSLLKHAWVRALYDFDGVDAQDLPFKKGDQIFIVGSAGSFWWIGLLQKKMGRIPYNYVEDMTADSDWIDLPREQSMMIK